MNTIRDPGVRAVGVNAVNQKLKNKKNKNKKNKQENHSAVVKSSVSIIVLDKKRSLNQEISWVFLDQTTWNISANNSHVSFLHS